MTRVSISLFSLGLFLASVPSLLLDDFHLVATFCLFSGGACLVLATMKAEWGALQSSFLLLLTSNAAFWLCYAFWHLRLRIAGPSPHQGIDTYAGILAEWFLLLLLLSLYEGGIFIWSAISNRHRGYALLGCAGLLIQSVTSLWFAYRLVQGV